MVRLSLSLYGRTQTWSDLVCLCVAGHMVRLSLSLCGRTQTLSDLVCLCMAGHKHCQT